MKKETSSTQLFHSSPPKGKYLVVTNKGPDGVDIPREDGKWDLMEIYFMPADIERIKFDPSITKAEHVVFETDRHNRKLAIVKKIFEAHDFWKFYDAIMITDDDILPHGCTMSAIFDFFMTTGCRIGQPAITQASPFSHMITVQNDNFVWRKTNFVEIQCPIFTQAALKDYLPFFDGTASQFGLDNYWSFLEWQQAKGLAVLDNFPVRHCRPIGEGMAYEGIDDHIQEGIDFLIKHRIPRFPYKCLGGVFVREPSKDDIRLAMSLSGYGRKILKNPQFTQYVITQIAGIWSDKKNL